MEKGDEKKMAAVQDGITVNCEALHLENEYRVGKRLREFVSGSKGVVEWAQLGTNPPDANRQKDK